MFEQRVYRNTASSAAGTLELIYHSTVRQIRKGQKAGGLGLLTNILQTLLMVGLFLALFHVLGLRAAAIRGDFLLYLMSGVFLFLTFNKSVGGTFGAPGPTSEMMLHAPMNTIIAIASSALAVLYLQLLSIFVILFVYHAAIQPITIHEPIRAASMILLTWFAGSAIGLVFSAMKPWAPVPVNAVKMVFMRLNLVFSGKMFVANAIPGFILPYFTWNPLFHTIDQARGFVFLNYNPHYTSVTYPLYLALGMVMLGLIGHFFTRQHASVSWNRR